MTDPSYAQITIDDNDNTITLTENDGMTGPFYISNKLEITINGSVYQTTYLNVVIRVGEPQAGVREFIVQPPQGYDREDLDYPSSP